ncbi:MAG: hypothetical protein FJY19_07740 [Bacteroidetes bacterium]|nr:hypothetical protein [Bacteroidota bacterium]
MEARRNTVRDGVIATYHVWSRCVQRAFLCGEDPDTKQNYDYRRDWITKLIQYQASLFAVDVGNYNILSNHEHLIVRTRPDIAAQWSPEEIAWRWKCAWPMFEDGEWWAQPTDRGIQEVMATDENIERVRLSLSSLSWFMARVKEPIAHLANGEMGRSGHFWEQRFGCRELVDEGGHLACMVYVDLNQVKAGQAPHLEDSNYSAIQERLVAWRKGEALAGVEAFLGKARKRRRDWDLSADQVESLLANMSLSPITPGGPPLLIRDVNGRIEGMPDPGTIPLVSNALDADSEIHADRAESVPNGCRVGGADEASHEPMVDEPMDSEEGSGGAEIVGNTGAEVLEALEREDEGGRLREVDRTVGDKSRTTHRSRRRARSKGDEPPPTYEIHNRMRKRWKRRASNHTFLDMPLGQYLDLVEWSADQLIRRRRSCSPSAAVPDDASPAMAWPTGTGGAGSAGEIPRDDGVLRDGEAANDLGDVPEGSEAEDGTGDPPEEMAVILSRFGIAPRRFLGLLDQLDRTCPMAVGSETSLREMLRRTGKKWCKGIRLARDAFS